MNKKKIIETAEFDKDVAEGMADRIANFRGALQKPDKRVGDKRAQRKPNPDFVAPEPEGVARFDQLNKQDRWSRTEFQETDIDGGHASINVKDPRDPGDLYCKAYPTVNENDKRRVTGEEEREAHPEKVSILEIDDIDPEGPNA